MVQKTDLFFFLQKMNTTILVHNDMLKEQSEEDKFHSRVTENRGFDITL